MSDGSPETAIEEPTAPASSSCVPKTLFIGLGATAVTWYRCVIPAQRLGCDWIGMIGEPPRSYYIETGMVGGKTPLSYRMPNPLDYEVVVMQQPRGTKWLKLIRELQRNGVKVVYEIDDYVHGIQKIQSHDYKRHFDKNGLARLEMTMRVSDAVICSTDFIARKYRRFNRRTFVCENGLDVERYNLTRPERATVNVGWAGATGHREAVVPWLQQVALVMRDNAHVNFVSVGMPFADGFREHFPDDRVMAVPWTLVDLYPAAMTLFDIALAPAGKGLFFRGKSDLRWLEAGALGIPTIADPVVYPKIDHGHDGFHATSPGEVRELLELLVLDPVLRLQVGDNARRYVLERRTASVVAEQWAGVLREVHDS